MSGLDDSDAPADTAPRRDAGQAAATIRVNGRPHPWLPGLTVAVLLAELDPAAGPVAVECNRRVVRRAEHAATALEPGDEIELVRLVGGG
ncbi:MAG TPA: sulfur carrier protein ThiS [Planctomycetota bacterium]